jgi:ATP-dependent RNA helicase SUPV3L1/SUV3
MLERLADILRQKDTAAGFEATPDMLSITGMTLEQFCDLMAGLGYKADKGERVKVKAAPVLVPVEVDPNAPVNPITEEESAFVRVEDPAPEGEAAEGEVAAPEMESFYTFTWAPKPRFLRPERGPRPEGAGRGPRKEGDAPQGERKPRGDRGPRKDGDAPKADRPQGDRPQGDRPRGDRPQGDRPQGERRHGKPEGKPQGERGDRGDRKGGKPNRDDRQKSFEARPPRPEKPIDPDNPFAALMALKGKL